MAQHALIHQFDPSSPSVGGIDSLLRDLITFAPDDVDWKVVGVSRDPSVPLARWRSIEVGGREVRFFPLVHLDPTANRKVPHTLRLAAALWHQRPDLGSARLHAHRTDVALAVGAAYRRHHLSVWFHTSTAAATGSSSDSLWRHLPGSHDRMESWVLRRADDVVCLGSEEAERLRRAGIEVEAAGAWFNDATFSAALPWPRGAEAPLRIAWAGRFEAPKDPVLAVDVAAALRSRGIDFEMVLAGSGSLYPAVAARIRAAGVSDQVSLPGPLAQEELASIFRSADVTLLTSHFEGAPRVLVEALACGTPVVAPAAADTDGLLSGDAGIAVRDRSAHALADAVLDARLLDRSSAASSVAERRASGVVPRLLAGVR